MIAETLIDEDIPQLLKAKAVLTGQRKQDLDPVAVSEDIVSRTFVCPIVQDVCKV